jgi:outer membrane protein, heavy metal efflux system
VINDVRRQFWRTLGAAQLVQIHEELLKNAQDRLVTTEEMFNVGQANEVDVRLARVALQQQRLHLRMTRNDHEQTRRELAALAGISLPSGPLTGSLECVLPPLTWDSSAAYILNESPELREAHAKLRSDQITVERERREPIPNVFVRGGVGYNFEAGQTVATAGVMVQPPLWNRNQGTRQQAMADLRRQQEEVRRVGLRLERDLATHYRDYLTALQHVEAYRDEILPEVEKAYKVQLESYKERRQTWPQVLDTQRGLNLRREEYIRNLVIWRENRTLIEGFLLKGGLEAPPRPTPPGHIDSVAQPR